MENEKQEKNIEKKKDFLLPISILIAAILIGGTIVWSTERKAQLNNNPNDKSANIDLSKMVEKISPLSEKDHLWGNINAPLKIIVFTDFECPFCKEFHNTIHQTLLEFGDEVVVAYRHFPIPALHQYAQKEAEASECVAEIGGEERFRQYVDKIFETTKSNDGLDPLMLPKLAVGLGINEKKFNECLSSGKYAEKVSNQSEEAVNVGAQGTPYAVIISPKGKKFPVPGAFPYNSTNPQIPSFKSIIEEALKN